MTIKQISAYQILDSRGEPTLEVVMSSATGNVAYFSVPAGSSVGNNEAREKRDGDTSVYDGLGVSSCIKVITDVITPKFVGYPLDQQKDFDDLLIALDGSAKKENLGANTLLALSGAYLKLSALEKNQPLWQYISEYNQTAPEFPRLMANIIGGGSHAPGLDIQEYMVVPLDNKPSVATQTIYNVYKTIRTVMQNLYGPSATLTGDEGGLAPIGTNSEVILEAFSQLNAKLGNTFEIALDAAANTFYKDGLYNIETQKLHASDLYKLYQGWDVKFNLYAIEDPFAENDLEGTEIIKTMGEGAARPFLVFADDYTVTNRETIATMQQDNLFDGIIIKPNQVGTMSETFEAIAEARNSKAKVIISHRSGETTDTFIADLAYGVGAMGLKLGAPVRGERVAKYNRLLEIEADLDTNQQSAVASSQNTNNKPQATSTQPAPPLQNTPLAPPSYIPPSSPLQPAMSTAAAPAAATPPVAVSQPTMPAPKLTT